MAMRRLNHNLALSLCCLAVGLSLLGYLMSRNHLGAFGLGFTLAVLVCFLCWVYAPWGD
jgi:hypothetical protein